MDKLDEHCTSNLLKNRKKNTCVFSLPSLPSSILKSSQLLNGKGSYKQQLGLTPALGSQRAVSSWSAEVRFHSHPTSAYHPSAFLSKVQTDENNRRAPRDCALKTLTVASLRIPNPLFGSETSTEIPRILKYKYTRQWLYVFRRCFPHPLSFCGKAQ